MSTVSVVSSISFTISFFAFRPVLLGAGCGSTVSGIEFDSSTSSTVSTSAGSSLNKGIGSLAALFFLRSKFSPSLPLTLYTRSVSFFTMRVLFLLTAG